MDPASKQLWKSMWAVFDHIKDFKFQGRQIGDPFVKLPNKSIYPDYYEGIFKIYYSFTIILFLKHETGHNRKFS